VSAPCLRPSPGETPPHGAQLAAQGRFSVEMAPPFMDPMCALSVVCRLL